MKRNLLAAICLLVLTAAPAQASSYLLWSMTGLGAVSDVIVDSSGLIYTGSNARGVYIVEPNAEGGPKTLFNWRMGGLNGETYAAAREVLVINDVLIVAHRTGGTRFVDVSDPKNPTLITTIANSTPANEGETSQATRLAVDGNMLYVSSVRGGVSRIDITNIRNPNYLDTLLFSTAAGTSLEGQGMSVDGNYLYIATPHEGWAVVDVSSLVSMEVVNSIEKPAGAFPGVWDVYVANGIAYVLAQSFGVEVFDVSDVNNIVKISEIKFPTKEGIASDSPPSDILFLNATLAAISYGSLGVYIYDFSNLALPMLIETLTADEMVAVNMFLDGATLYVAGFWGGLFAFDLSPLLATPLPGALLFGFTGLSALYLKRRKG